MTLESSNAGPCRSTPPCITRIVVALAIGLAFGSLAAWVQPTSFGAFSDFDQTRFAGAALLEHESAYDVIYRYYEMPLYYPPTVGVVGVPFALLPRRLATGLWVFTSFSLLALGLSARGWWRLIGLASFPAIYTAQLGQWSAMTTAIGVVPGLAWLAVAKPSTGGAVALAYLPATLTRRTVALGALILALSILLTPMWWADWHKSLGDAEQFRPLIFRPFGFLLLLALLRWRRAEARLLAFLAVIPHTSSPYEALTLALIPSSFREGLVLALLSFGMLPWLVMHGHTFADLRAAVHYNAVIVFVFQYLPALIMVLTKRSVHLVDQVADTSRAS